jgi:Holliday junction resolvase
MPTRTNNSYKRGSNFERYVVEKLNKLPTFFSIRSAGSHTVCDVLSVGIGLKTSNYPTVLFIQCKTSKVETIPDLKQLLNGENIKLLNKYPVSYYNTHKIVLWKGKGRNNLYAYRFMDIDKSWIGSKINSIEEYISSII